MICTVNFCSHKYRSVALHLITYLIGIGYTPGFAAKMMSLESPAGACWKARRQATDGGFHPIPAA